jgi:hypothetical protein
MCEGLEGLRGFPARPRRYSVLLGFRTLAEFFLSPDGIRIGYVRIRTSNEQDTADRHHRYRASFARDLLSKFFRQKSN